MPARNLTIITGGSRGIGRLLVQTALRDTDVLNISRQPATRRTPTARHVLHDLGMDLQYVDRIEPALSGWFAKHPDYRVRLLINNAAALDLGWLHELSGSQIEHAFRVNVHAPLAITSGLLRQDRFASAGCRIVYVVSSLGRAEPELSFAGMGLYSATKAALGRLALVQAREFALTAPHLEIVRIHPGIVDTEMQDTLRQDPRMDPRFTEKTAGLPPYREGDWDDGSPAEHPRTVSPAFAAEFIMWAARSPKVDSDSEYDFYRSSEFHAARRGRPTSPDGDGEPA